MAWVPDDASRPLIVGMNNPLSLDPKYALYPTPKGCAGHRLYEMLRAVESSVTMSGYARRFERVNLVVGPWSASSAKIRAHEMIPALVGRRVVLLGREVAKSFGFSDKCDFSVGGNLGLHGCDGSVFYVLPHPSGRNPLYNDPEVRRAAGEVLARLWRGDDT
jgi:hypothetical protein